MSFPDKPSWLTNIPLPRFFFNHFKTQKKYREIKRNILYRLLKIKTSVIHFMCKK